MKARYYIYLVEFGRTVQGDVIIEESALKEVLRYFFWSRE